MELADQLAIDLDQGRVPDIAALSALFGPNEDAMPEVSVIVLTPLAAYEDLGTVRVILMLSDLRLPAIKACWPEIAARSDKEGWPVARFLAALLELETAERARRRFERHLEEARLSPGKTLATFDFTAVPMVSKAQVMALAAGDSWLEKGANLILFGPPGGGKSHLSAALP